VYATWFYLCFHSIAHKLIVFPTIELPCVARVFVACPIEVLIVFYNVRALTN